MIVPTFDSSANYLVSRLTAWSKKKSQKATSNYQTACFGQAVWYDSQAANPVDVKLKQVNNIFTLKMIIGYQNASQLLI